MTGSCSTPHRLPGLAVIIVVGAIFLSGCGSSTGGSGTTSPAGAAGGGASTPHSRSATTAPSAAPTNAASSSAAGAGGAAGSGFCTDAALAEAAQRKDASSLAVDSPAALQKFEEQTLAKLQGFLALAPSAIKSDLAVIVAADRQLYNTLAAAHFDMRKIDSAALAKLATPQFQRAVRAITSYLAKACGISPSTSS